MKNEKLSIKRIIYYLSKHAIAALVLAVVILLAGSFMDYTVGSRHRGIFGTSSKKEKMHHYESKVYFFNKREADVIVDSEIPMGKPSLSFDGYAMGIEGTDSPEEYGLPEGAKLVVTPIGRGNMAVDRDTMMLRAGSLFPQDVIASFVICEIGYEKDGEKVEPTRDLPLHFIMDSSRDFTEEMGVHLVSFARPDSSGVPVEPVEEKEGSFDLLFSRSSYYLIAITHKKDQKANGQAADTSRTEDAPETENTGKTEEEAAKEDTSQTEEETTAAEDTSQTTEPAETENQEQTKKEDASDEDSKGDEPVVSEEEEQSGQGEAADGQGESTVPDDETEKSYIYFSDIKKHEVPGRQTQDEEESSADSESGGTELLDVFDDHGDLLYNQDVEQVSVRVNADYGTFPEGTTMDVKAVWERETIEKIADTVGEKIDKVRAVDITFYDEDGTEIQPSGPVRVTMSSEFLSDARNPAVVHVNDDGRASKIYTLKDKDVKGTISSDEIVFDVEHFSIYAIVTTTIEKKVLASDGHNYKISLTYGSDAKIPKNSTLEVEELGREAYEEYFVRTAMELDAADFDYARIFDITIKDPQGGHVKPAAPVNVSIELMDAKGQTQDFSVVHFNEEKGKASLTETMEATTDGNVVSFSTDSFSAYAIVQGPSALPAGWSQVTTMESLQEYAAGGLYIGTTGGFYLTGKAAAGSQDRSTNGIIKTTPSQSFPPKDKAVKYYPEAASGEDEFYFYCLDENGQRKYVRNTGDANLYLVDESQKTAFKVLLDKNGRFRFQNGGRYWNMWNGTGGNHIAAWTSATDANNYFYIWKAEESDSDSYGLDGKSYGLMNWAAGVSGRAMMSGSSLDGYLDAMALTVMSRAGANEDKLFVPSDSEISQWTFHWIEDDIYYLTTKIDGTNRFLKILKNGISLTVQPDEACRIRVIPGTGIHEGEISLMAGNNSLIYSGQIGKGFTTGTSAGKEWLKLVEISELSKDYFLTYSASKVSVSDKNVTDNSRIIIYTRVWNDIIKKYEFYALDHDGSLVRCYESGDSVEWVGSRLNSLLWNFKEYYWEGTKDPNYYYDLYNQYSEKYIAPQTTGEQVLSAKAPGINLNGRRDGQFYSSILTWDDENYSYVGLKADVETGRVVSCPKSEADDFYFAIMQDLPLDDELTAVPTVDNTRHGITMKMTNFNDRAAMSSFLGSDNGYKQGNTEPGLLNTALGSDGYPVTKAKKSLGDWFKNAGEVNHLFIDSTFRASGYYEYDSVQNFAHLDNKTGDFVVYKEIGTTDNQSGKFYTHGQFFPYNDIKAGGYSKQQNLTDALGKNLPESDPRKYEQLYNVCNPTNPDYYMGMEVNASFTQTPDGLDDWGHDIIYEFTGDDDFWLFVDGELIIDLGGVHDALAGSVNYRTGDVYVNGKHTTIKDLFYKNYKDRGHTEKQTKNYIDSIFKVNSDGQYIFKDYTTHTMKIFYLERGAGASNLHMRFNLASIKQGTVELGKNLSGVDKSESVLAQFPYQIYYRTESGGRKEYRLTNSMPDTPTQTEDYVVFKDTDNPVPYQKEFTVDKLSYEDVFFLKPGEIAEISFPEGTTSYRVVECGVNTDVYRKVTVNGENAQETAANDYPANRKDYGISHAAPDDRARVIYDNEVDPDALRTLTFKKKLFKEDGVTELNYTDDATVFSFRLFLGTEYEEEPASANMHTYHVKDPDGAYCTWDSAGQKFISSGMKDYNRLSDKEKAAASFTTSMNGSISKIPAGFTVEVRNVLAGTRFRVVERPDEIPDGYSFQKYEYNRKDYDGNKTDPQKGVSDTVSAKQDPHVDICNLKGWGLRVNKVFTDADYMADRKETYFAVFTDDGKGELTLVDNTLRQLTYKEKTLYWYFLPLPVRVPFDQYEIREVKVAGAKVSEDGYVSSYDSMEIIDEGGEVKIDGKQKGEKASSSFAYKVSYQKGRVSADSNVRTDIVTNSRPGIVLRKEDWDGNPLAGAAFSLSDEEDHEIGSFVSDAEGRITTAFLRENVDYKLKETSAPKGYQGLLAPMTIRLSGNTVRISGVDKEYYRLDQKEDQTNILTIRNREFMMKLIKTSLRADGSGTPLPGVSFALHREVKVDSVTGMELTPLAGYENLVSQKETGIVPMIDQSLHDPGQTRSYYLVEKAPASGYLPLKDHVRFTVTAAGEVKLTDHEMAELKQEVDAATGRLTYTIRVKNLESAASIRIIKTDQMDKALEGAVFSISGAEIDAEENLRSKIPVDGTDAEIYTNENMAPGTYTLTETEAPGAYIKLKDPVIIKIGYTDSGVSVKASMGGQDLGYPLVMQDQKTGIWTIKIINGGGFELPHTGGSGRDLFVMLGTAMALMAGLLLVIRHRIDVD